MSSSRLIGITALVAGISVLGMWLVRSRRTGDVLPPIGGDTWPPVPTKDAPGRA